MTKLLLNAHKHINKYEASQIFIITYHWVYKYE